MALMDSQAVAMARSSIEVCTTSNVSPASFIVMPASNACFTPLRVSLTSDQPVNFFSRFQTLSP